MLPQTPLAIRIERGVKHRGPRAALPHGRWRSDDAATTCGHRFEKDREMGMSCLPPLVSSPRYFFEMPTAQLYSRLPLALPLMHHDCDRVQLVDLLVVHGAALQN